MKTLSIIGLSIGTALFSALPVSLQFSQDGVSVSLDKANAVIGRPLTPGSVAGVNRRVHRRAARRAYHYDAAAGTATPYENQNWGNWNGAGPGYGVARAAVAASTPYNNGNWGYWNGAGPAYGVTAAGPAARAAVARVGYYGVNRAYPEGNYAGWNGSSPNPNANYYPTRAMYSGSYLPPSYFGPVCNPQYDNSCQ